MTNRSFFDHINASGAALVASQRDVGYLSADARVDFYLRTAEVEAALAQAQAVNLLAKALGDGLRGLRSTPVMR